MCACVGECTCVWRRLQNTESCVKSPAVAVPSSEQSDVGAWNWIQVLLKNKKPFLWLTHLSGTTLLITTRGFIKAFSYRLFLLIFQPMFLYPSVCPDLLPCMYFHFCGTCILLCLTLGCPGDLFSPLSRVLSYSSIFDR